jgi:hypothetical protein
MFNVVRTTWGQCLASQKIVPGDTVTSLDSKCYVYTEYTFTYNSGSAAPSAGAWLIGATSSALGVVVSVTLASGTWGGGDAAGTIRLKSVSGTFNGTENINNGSSGNVLTMTSVVKPVVDDYMFKGLMAKAAMLICSGNIALVGIDGSTMDQTALIGVPLNPTQSIVVQDTNDIKNCKVVDYASGSASTVRVLYWF